MRYKKYSSVEIAIFSFFLFLFIFNGLSFRVANASVDWQLSLCNLGGGVCCRNADGDIVFFDPICYVGGGGPLIGPRYIPPGYYGGPVNTASGFVSLLSIVLGWVQAVFWILAVASGLYAAYLYLLSSGDPEKVKKATKQIVYTVVAIIVAILAYAIPNILDNFFFG